MPQNSLLFRLAMASRELSMVSARQQWNSHQDAVKGGVGCQAPLQLLRVVADQLAHFVDVGRLLHLLPDFLHRLWVLSQVCAALQWRPRLPLQLTCAAEVGRERWSSGLALDSSCSTVSDFFCFISSAFLPDYWSCCSTMTSYLPPDAEATSFHTFSSALKIARGPILLLNPVFHITNSGSALLTELWYLYTWDMFAPQHLCSGSSLCLDTFLLDDIITNSVTSFKYSLSLSNDACLNHLLKISVSLLQTFLKLSNLLFFSSFVPVIKYYTFFLTYWDYVCSLFFVFPSRM